MINFFFVEGLISFIVFQLGNQDAIGRAISFLRIFALWSWYSKGIPHFRINGFSLYPLSVWGCWQKSVASVKLSTSNIVRNTLTSVYPLISDWWQPAYRRYGLQATTHSGGSWHTAFPQIISVIKPQFSHPEIFIKSHQPHMEIQVTGLIQMCFQRC